MVLAIIAVIIGLIILVWSADTFIEGATKLALRFNVPSFLVGVIILGVGTSAPELVVSALSAMAGSPGIALGNAYGSNIINISLVLGLTAIISPIVIRSQVVKQDLILLLLITVLATWQLVDGSLSVMDGVVLITALVAVLLLQILLALRNTTDVTVKRDKNINAWKAFFTLLLGVSLLIGSSKVIVWGAVELATLWGMSELLIGLTIVAVGTSLPELVASIAAARKNQHDMALGNVIGSNLFNTLGVVGMAAIISPMEIEHQLLTRDMLMVVICTVLLFLLSVIAFTTRSKLKASSGYILLATFVAYTVWLFFTSIS